MTTRVDMFRANAFGLYDMHGNVSQWCQDWHDVYGDGNAIDPTGPAKGSHRVIRGGCWEDRGRNCRSATSRRL